MMNIDAIASFLFVRVPISNRVIMCYGGCCRIGEVILDKRCSVPTPTSPCSWVGTLGDIHMLNEATDCRLVIRMKRVHND